MGRAGKLDHNIDKVRLAARVTATARHAGVPNIDTTLEKIGQDRQDSLHFQNEAGHSGSRMVLCSSANSSQRTGQ